MILEDKFKYNEHIESIKYKYIPLKFEKLERVPYFDRKKDFITLALFF